MQMTQPQKCPRCKGTGTVPVADLTALRQQRKAAGLTSLQMAKRLRLSPSYLCDIELGRRNCPEQVLKAYGKL